MSICKLKNFALVAAFAFATANVATAQIEKETGKPVPMLMESGSKTEEQSKEEQSKVAAENKGSQILFHSKIILEKEKQYNNIRAYLNKFNGEELVNTTIRSMYLPAIMEAISCDFNFPESFDKTSLPENVPSYRAEILKYIEPQIMDELSFCFSYMGFQVTDEELYLYYVAPYKLNIAVLKGTRLHGRELAWLIANDFKQSVCVYEPQIVIPKDHKESLEKRASQKL